MNIKLCKIIRGSNLSDYTSLRIRKATKKRLIETRGKMESQNGKRRSIEDVIDELVDFFDKGTDRQ